MISTLPVEPVGEEDSGVSRVSIDEWIEEVAASQDISEQELIDRMTSSHWILNELTELINESGGRNPSTEQSGSESKQGTLTSIDQNEEAYALVEILSSVEGESNGSQPEQLADSLNSEIDRLQKRTDQLNTRIDNVVGGGDDDSESAENHLFDSAAGKDLHNMSEKLETLSNRIAELESQQEDERRRVNENFEQIEDIIQSLIDSLGTLDDRFSELAEQIESPGEETDRETLSQLKHRANDEGIQKASCDGCGESVDISLLEYARCPSCERPFDGLSPKSGWLWFGTNTLTTPDELEGI